MAKSFILGLIRIYQRTLSLDHGWLKGQYPAGYCKFQPTCSQYTYTAIERYGTIRGGWIGLKRIIRCNPWSKGREDKLT